MRTCPDCAAEMQRIKLIDQRGTGGAVRGDRELGYAAADANQSFWLGEFPREGRVAGWMCSACHRVLLYAEPD